MEEKDKGWQQFQRVKLHRKQLTRRAKKIETAGTRHAHRFVIRRISNIRLVQREVTVWLLIVGAIIAGLGAQTVWGQMNYMKAAPAAGGSYVEAAVGPINSLNPLYMSSSAESSVSRLVFSSLYTYDEVSSLRGDIADSLVVSEGGKVYTVTIRDDVQWHDGTPLSAKDVVFTVNLMKNPLTRSALRINWVDVSVKEVSKDTVQFTLPASYAAFPYALTFAILPEHLLGSINPAAVREHTFSQAPVGSGPFKFELFQQVDPIRNIRAVHMTANRDYYAGPPKLDRFELQAHKDEDAIIKALKAGEVSGAADVSAKSSDLVSEGRYAKTPLPLSSGVYLMFNTISAPFNDAKVRKALQVGTNASAVREDIGHGTRPLELPFIGAQVGDVTNLPKAPAYNPVEANRILEEAGWKLEANARVKDGKKLQITITTTKSKEYESSAEIVRSQWSKLGIDVKKKVIDASAENSNFVQDTLQGRNFEVLLYELAIGADPDVYAYWHSSQMGQSGYNFTSYANKTADAALASARARTEPELRNAKYRQFAKLWLDDVPAIGLYQPVVEYISTKRSSTVGEYARVVTSSDRYANVLNWTVDNGTVYKTP